MQLRCRKYRWTLSWLTTIGSERQILLATSNSAATLRGRSYATGATCWPIRADQSRNGTRYRKYPRRTKPGHVNCTHSNQVAANWVRSRDPVGKSLSGPFAIAEEDCSTYYYYLLYFSSAVWIHLRC